MSQETYLEKGSLWACNKTATLPMLWDSKGRANGMIKRHSIILILEDTQTDSNSYAHILIGNRDHYVDAYWWKLGSFTRVA